MTTAVPSETSYERIEKDAKSLKLNLSQEEFALYASKHQLCDKDISNVETFLNYLVERKNERVVETCLRFSKLPKEPKTFENFDFNRLHGTDLDKLKALSSLAPLYAHQTIAFIGSQGTGNYAKQLIM